MDDTQEASLSSGKEETDSSSMIWRLLLITFFSGVGFFAGMSQSWPNDWWTKVSETDILHKIFIHRVYNSSSRDPFTIPMENERYLKEKFFKREYSKPALQLRMQKTTGKLRKAFIITGDINNKRTARTKKILERVGFIVVFQLIIPHPEKKVSNRLTHMELYRLISLDTTEPWGYIFENDIQVLNTSWRLNPEILAYEAIHDEFMWLGLCTLRDFFPQTRLQCGLCAHAYALTPKGAQNLLTFTLNQNSTYDGQPQDAITFRWCMQEKGFPVVGWKYFNPSKRGHRGIFYQDRRTFHSKIGR